MQDGELNSNAEVVIERPEAGVAVLRLNRADTRNSLSLSMMDALSSGLTMLTDDAAVRAIVLAANGPAFCAGHDMKELTAHRPDADGGRAFYVATMNRCAALMQQVVACPKPVIAAVHATATAAGCQLVATCDLAVAADTAQILHARRQYRALLLDADGGAVSQRATQAGDGNASPR